MTQPANSYRKRNPYKNLHIKVLSSLLISQQAYKIIGFLVIFSCMHIIALSSFLPFISPLFVLHLWSASSQIVTLTHTHSCHRHRYRHRYTDTDIDIQIHTYFTYEKGHRILTFGFHSHYFHFPPLEIPFPSTHITPFLHSKFIIRIFT